MQNLRGGLLEVVSSEACTRDRTLEDWTFDNFLQHVNKPDGLFYANLPLMTHVQASISSSRRYGHTRPPSRLHTHLELADLRVKMALELHRQLRKLVHLDLGRIHPGSDQELAVGGVPKLVGGGLKVQVLDELDAAHVVCNTTRQMDQISC